MRELLAGRKMESVRDRGFPPPVPALIPSLARRRRMRVVHRTGLRVLVLLSLLTLLSPLAGRVAVAQTVGASTIDGGAEWQYSTEASSPNGGILVHQSLSETYFMYLEEDLSALPSPDNAALLEGVTLPRFREAFGITDMPQLAQGNLVTGLWHLYEMPSDAGTVLVLFAVDVTLIPGAGAVEILIAPKAAFAEGLASATANITINGGDTQLVVVPGTAILNAAGLPSNTASTTQTTQVPATTPAAVPTSTPAQATIPTSTPAVAGQQGAPLTQTMTVGPDTVAYGGDWQYNQENSSAEIGFFIKPADSTVVYAYLNGPNNIGADPLTSVQGGTDAFFADFGAQNVQQVTAEVLPSGLAWGLTTFDRNGIPGAFLIQTDVTTSGVVRAQFLIAPREGFATYVTSAQQSFQINGVSAYSEIDVDTVASLLGGAPAQPTPAGGAPAQPTPAGQTSQPSGGDVASYRAQDAPTGCDAIGWVMTDPSQLPVSQADLDARSGCVGGGTYAASCGTYLDSGTGVHCTVNVAVGTAPMAVTSQQFTLVDAAGNRYPVDLEVMMTHVMVLGGAELPETTVDAGTTMSGTLIFNPPSNAPTPWVIEIAPDTIATTGEQPGILVIEGPLQPYGVFGQ
jgi:hypothetical protein